MRFAVVIVLALITFMYGGVWFGLFFKSVCATHQEEKPRETWSISHLPPLNPA